MLLFERAIADLMKAMRAERQEDSPSVVAPARTHQCRNVYINGNGGWRLFSRCVHT